jgi:hypothetical protein
MDVNSPGYAAYQNAMVQAAFDEVAKHFPDVSVVNFDEDGRWQFAGADNVPYLFPKGQVDLGPLEDAQGVVDSPSKYSRDV